SSLICPDHSRFAFPRRFIVDQRDPNRLKTRKAHADALNERFCDLSVGGHRFASEFEGEGVVAQAGTHTLYIAQSPERMTLDELGDIVRESIVGDLHKNPDARPIPVYQRELRRSLRRRPNTEKRMRISTKHGFCLELFRCPGRIAERW